METFFLHFLNKFHYISITFSLLMVNKSKQNEISISIPIDFDWEEFTKWDMFNFYLVGIDGSLCREFKYLHYLLLFIRFEIKFNWRFI